MKKFCVFGVLALMLMFAGCQGGSSGSKSTFTPSIGAKLIGGSSSSVSSSMRSVGKSESYTPQIDAFGINEIEIVAYQYSPGYQDDAGFSYTADRQANDWAYDVICAGGYERSRALKSGQSVDIASWTGGRISTISSKFAETYKSFSLDFLEVMINLPGIFVGSNYYGTDIMSDYSSTYPSPIKYIMGPLATSVAPNGCGQAFNIILARSDWFPEALNISVAIDSSSMQYVIHSIVGGDLSTVITLDDGSTITQKDMILSMLNNGTKRRFYGVLYIVPYGAPVKVATTEDGPGIKNPQANLVFNFDWSSMITPSTQAAIANNTFAHLTVYGDWIANDGQFLVYQVTNNVPFGISCTITDPATGDTVSN